MRVVFVHGACVRDGEWWWRPTAERLARCGIASVAPELPSCGETGGPAGVDGPGLPEDVDAVRAVLLDSDEPTVIVGHSYGGIVATAAGAGGAHLLYVSSYLAEPGESLSSFGRGEPSPFLDVDPVGGTFGVRPDLLVETFLHDCPTGIADDAGRHTARQSLVVTQQPVAAAAWHEVPSTYLVCSADRGTPAAAQRDFAARAGRVVEIDAGHHPFLSRPDDVAELVAGLA